MFPRSTGRGAADDLVTNDCRRNIPGRYTTEDLFLLQNIRSGRFPKKKLTQQIGFMFCQKIMQIFRKECFFKV